MGVLSCGWLEDFGPVDPVVCATIHFPPSFVWDAPAGCFCFCWGEGAVWLWDAVLKRKQQNASELSKAVVEGSYGTAFPTPAQQRDQRCQCQDEPKGSPGEPKREDGGAVQKVEATHRNQFPAWQSSSSNNIGTCMELSSATELHHLIQTTCLPGGLFVMVFSLFSGWGWKTLATVALLPSCFCSWPCHQHIGTVTIMLLFLMAMWGSCGKAHHNALVSGSHVDGFGECLPFVFCSQSLFLWAKRLCFCKLLLLIWMLLDVCVHLIPLLCTFRKFSTHNLWFCASFTWIGSWKGSGLLEV